MTLSRIISAVLIIAALLRPAGLRADDFAEMQARSAPAWLRDGVVYEIYPRNFSAAGDFNGITARLDDLKNLGVTVLWIMPIHPIGQKLRKGDFGSPYSVKDYYAINPAYGTEADLKRLISEAHRRGLKVLIDMVANHTAWDSVMMAHPEFYKRDSRGHIEPPVPDWSDVAGLNYANPELRRYMITMFKHWIDPAGFDFDGMRCDVASMVPTDFWEEARAQLMQVKPDVAMLAEASKPELMVKAFDIDYDWPMLSALNDCLMRGEPATGIRRAWEDSRRQFPQGTLYLRMSDDHDEPRAVARFGCEGALAASALLFTLDGVPLLYNGMESGDATESGDPALFEKLPIFWHSKGRPPLNEIYAGLIRLRKSYPALRGGSVIWLANSDDANVVTFLREDDADQFVVAVNFSNRPETVDIDAPGAGFVPEKMEGLDAPPRDFPHLRLNGFEWRIFHRAAVGPLKEAETTSPKGN